MNNKTSIQWTQGSQIDLSNNKKMRVKNGFEQQDQKIFRKKKISEKKLGKTKFGKKFLKTFLDKNLKKVFGKKILKFFFQLQVTIPSAHPVQISSRSDYCITLS